MSVDGQSGWPVGRRAGCLVRVQVLLSADGTGAEACSGCDGVHRFTCGMTSIGKRCLLLPPFPKRN